MTQASRLKYRHDEMKHRALALENKWARKTRESEEKILALKAEISALLHSLNEQQRQRHQQEEALTSQIGELERALAMKDALLSVFQKELTSTKEEFFQASQEKSPFESVPTTLPERDVQEREYTLPYSLEALGQSRATTLPEMELPPYSKASPTAQTKIQTKS